MESLSTIFTFAILVPLPFAGSPENFSSLKICTSFCKIAFNSNFCQIGSYPCKRSHDHIAWDYTAADGPTARVAESEGIGVDVESPAARLTKLDELGNKSVEDPTARLAKLEAMESDSVEGPTARLVRLKELGNGFLSQMVKHLFVSQHVFTEHRAVGGQSSFELQSFKFLQLAPAPAQKL